MRWPRFFVLQFFRSVGGFDSCQEGVEHLFTFFAESFNHILLYSGPRRFAEEGFFGRGRRRKRTMCSSVP